MATEKLILENIEKGLLPCGCKQDKCQCKMTDLEYVLEYSKYLPLVKRKHNKIKIIKKGLKKILTRGKV